MTIATRTSKAAFSGNGVTTVFPLPFPFRRAADIKAVLREGGTEIPLQLGSHFLLSGAGSAEGGQLTMAAAPAQGQTLVVWRAPDIVQEVDYVENAAFPAETHEGALDLLTMVCQSLQEQMDRAVLYPVSTPGGEVLDSPAFLGCAAASRDAAQQSARESAASAEQAGQSAAQSAASAGQAAQSAARAESVAAALDGAVKVSATDAVARSLSVKLAAADGLAESVLDPGGDETMRLSVALAATPGLEFASGLLRVKAGQGLTLSASGLAADAGTGAGQLVRLDAAGRLPALDARNLTHVADQLPRDLAAMNALVSWLAAGRASGPLPKGFLWTFANDEWIKTDAYYDELEDVYANVNEGTVEVGSPAAGGNGLNGYTACNSACTITNGRVVTGVRMYSTSGGTIVPYILRDDGSNNHTVVATGPAQVHPGGGWATLALSGAYTVPATGTYRPAAYSASFGGGYVTTTRIHKNGTANGTQTYIVDTNTCVPFGYVYGGAATNMAIDSPPVSLGFIPAKATAYVLHRSVDAVRLNTDIMVGASRGSGWASATDLADLGAFDCDYKLLRAAMDVSSLASGQTGSVRVQTAFKRQYVRAVLAWFE